MDPVQDNESETKEVWSTEQHISDTSRPPTSPTMAVLGLHPKAFAYSTTVFASSFMGSVFGYYYVKIYLNYFHVTEGWFQFAQVMYLLWNMLNDPLFGYMQDNLDYAWAKSRRHSILYGAPLWGLSFMLAWLPWSRTNPILSGLHLTFTLCFWDTLLTFIILAHCSLSAELSRKHEDRVRLVKYSQYASILGSTGVFFCEYFSENLQNFGNFQITTLVIATISTLAMVYTGLKSSTIYDDANISSTISTDAHGPGSSTWSAFKLAWHQTLQVLKNRNFLSYVLVNFCQTYEGAYLGGFSMIMIEQLVKDQRFHQHLVKSTYYGSLALIPKLCTIAIMPLMPKCGYYPLVQYSFVFKILLGCTLLTVGPNPYFILIFFLVNSINHHMPGTFGNLILSDVIDQDKITHQRKHPLSSMVFGTNALITKPALSIAPMITVAILNRYGYQEVKNQTSGNEELQLQVNTVMFQIACLTSVVIGFLQLGIWSYYRIRNSHKEEEIKLSAF